MPIFRYNETAGNYYAYLIEGHGDDANDGLTPETAVETLDRLVEILDTYAGASRRHAVIVKNRIYNEAITVARTAGRPITFEFVGRCEIDGSGATSPTFNITNDYIYQADIINYNSGGLIIGTAYVYFYDCLFDNNTIALRNTTSTAETYIFFINCILTDALMRSNDNGINNYSITNCVIIGTLACSSANRRWIIKNSILYNATVSSNTRLTLILDYSCVYNSTIGGSDFAALQTAGFNLNGIGTNPQFTDPANGQYTVNQSSPCLYRGEGGDHIGIGEGFYLQTNILYFQQSVINNFQLTTGRLGFIDPLDNAFIETNPIDIGQIITLESAELAAILPTVAGEFTAGPVHYSHWYPAYSAASTYHKGAGVTDSAILYRSLVDDNLNNTPASSATEWERLTWESGVSYAAGKIVQYTDDKWYKANTATSTSWVAGEWDEVVMTREWNLQVKTGRTYDEAVAADWATIPYNVTPLLDTAGKGNSDDAYNPATGAVMVFRFIAVRIDAKTIV